MEPLPFQIIDRASRLRDETPEATHLRLTRLRSYLRVSGKGLEGAQYALFHKSLSDWLTDPDAAGSYWCFPERGKEQLDLKAAQFFARMDETDLECASLLIVIGT